MTRSFLIPANNSGDWLLDAQSCVDVILETMSACDIDRNARVFVPGVGLSRVPVLLHGNGVHNLTLLDIEPGAISRQKELFGEADVHITEDDHVDGRTPGVILILSSLETIGEVTFDVIIDKSFTDVFIAQRGAAGIIRRIRGVTHRDTLLIIFSIFNRVWRRLLDPRDWQVGYRNIEVARHSDRPPGKRRCTPNPDRCIEQNIAILAAVRNGADASYMDDVGFTDFSTIEDEDLPPDAA